MKRINIKLEVSDEEIPFGEEIEDRLAIILGRLGFEGCIESDLTDNQTSVPLSEWDTTETSWVDGNIEIKRQLVGGPICNCCGKPIGHGDEARDCCDKCLIESGKKLAKLKLGKRK